MVNAHHSPGLAVEESNPLDELQLLRQAYASECPLLVLVHFCPRRPRLFTPRTTPVTIPAYVSAAFSRFDSAVHGATADESGALGVVVVTGNRGHRSGGENSEMIIHYIGKVERMFDDFDRREYLWLRDTAQSW